MLASKGSSLRQSKRRGTIVPFLALTITALIGFLALAIDVGMLIIAKTQAQNAADLAALTAARTLNGDSTTTYNKAQASTNAQNVLTYNTILGSPIQTSQLTTLNYGSYDYNQTTQTFSANFPATANVPYTAAYTTVTSGQSKTGFSSIFGLSLLPNVTATAVAVHRPRDLAMVLDLSGSMRFGTCLGYDFYTSSRTTNNADTTVPAFGAYSSASAGLIGTSSNRTSSYDNYTISSTNTTAATTSFAFTYVNNFYQNTAYASTLIRAFDSYSSTDSGQTWTAPTSQRPQLPSASYATTPGGDVPLFTKGSSTVYAQNVNDVLGVSPNTTNSSASNPANALWELDGYSAYTGGKPDTSGTGSGSDVWSQVDYSAAGCQFNGYTQGPGYYGKTFFLWPPDPRTTTALSGTTLTNFLGGLGITNATDQATLSAIWSTWQGQGVGPGSTGLGNLQAWLKGTAKGGASSLPVAGPYSSVQANGPYVPGVTTWNGTALTSANKPLVYNAVCRLFNRAYPAGSSWTGSTLNSGASFHADWRMRFFGTNDNTKLFSSGSLALPQATTYTINYTAILSWIAGAQDPFPTQMRAGRVKYYSSIPASITGSWPNYGSTDQQFWKEYIDNTLGLRQTSSTAYTDVSALVGYGSDFTWGTASLSAPPTTPPSPAPYMNYSDIPARPKLRFWFGPLTMVDYLNNYNMNVNYPSYYFMQPGDSYEAPVYPGKQAYVAAINTMKTNHPNDWFSLVAYSYPRGASNGTVEANTYLGRFNCVRSPLGPNYTYAQAALLFPFSTLNTDGSCNNTEVTPYDKDPANNKIPAANFVDTPRADGETCFAMGLMLAYNQFACTLPSDATLRSFATSSPITFPSGMAGGLGRKGAQKVVIFETDGLANTGATANLVTATGYNYYQIRYDMNNPGGSEFPLVNIQTINNTTVLNQVNQLVQQLASDYGTSRNPFRLYALGFGPVFQGSDASSALQTLQNMQFYAGTQSSASTALPSSQVITGTGAQMSANMITTFTTLLENGVQIALIQ